MTEYANFYENLKEARRRIGDTVVLYDGLPYYVLCISDHRSDGIFRVYLDPLVMSDNMEHQTKQVPFDWHDEPNRKVGHVMDEYLDKNKDSKIIRKMMNSPKFDRFRPFPLGMCNFQGGVSYLSRMPTRPLTNQGLVGSGIKAERLCLSDARGMGGRMYCPPLFHPSMCSAILGVYPSINDVIENLLDPEVSEDGCAFHREFAIMRGPVNTLFLSYKTDIIGILSNKDRSKVILPKEFAYCKEVTEELGVFSEVVVDQ